MSTLHDLHVDAGEPFTFAARWLHADNNPYLLADAVIEAQVRTRFATGVMDPAPVAEFTCVGGDDGWLYLSLTAEQTAELPPGVYVYDVLVTPSGGDRTRLLRGSVHVSPAVTVVEDES